MWHQNLTLYVFSVTHLPGRIWAWARSSTVSPSAPSVPASWCRPHQVTGALSPQSTACCCHPACAPGPLMWVIMKNVNAEYETSAFRDNKCILFGRVCTWQWRSVSEHILHSGRESGLPAQSTSNISREDHGMSISSHFGFQVITCSLLWQEGLSVDQTLKMTN